MKKIETKMTASELQDAVKAARAKVRLHFTANGNPAWSTVYRYGKNDRQIGSDRLTKKEANERLAEFGLTANLVVEIESAIEQAQADKFAAMKASGEIYTAGRNCHKLTDDEVNAIYAKFAAGEVIADNTVKFEVGKRYAGKSACGSMTHDIIITVVNRTAKCIFWVTKLTATTSPFRTKIKSDGTTEFISDNCGHCAKASDIINEPATDEVKAEPATVKVEVDAAEYAISEDAFNCAVNAEIELATATVEHDPLADMDTTAFDAAVEESKEDDRARLDICGETLAFEDGHVTEVASLRYEAYFKISNGRKTFYYRGNRVGKQDFFAHIATEDKATVERKTIAEFVTRYGGSEILPALEMYGNYVAQIHVTLSNGRTDHYAAAFDTKDAAHAFIEDFKILLLTKKKNLL